LGGLRSVPRTAVRASAFARRIRLLGGLTASRSRTSAGRVSVYAMAYEWHVGCVGCQAPCSCIELRPPNLSIENQARRPLVSVGFLRCVPKLRRQSSLGLALSARRPREGREADPVAVLVIHACHATSGVAATGHGRLARSLGCGIRYRCGVSPLFARTMALVAGPERRPRPSWPARPSRSGGSRGAGRQRGMLPG
jgi:hypothetical protein